MKQRYLIILFLIYVFAGCSQNVSSPRFGFDTDVIPLGVDRTEYPEENEDGEIPDEAWEDFRYEAEYYLVSTRTGERVSDVSYPGISSFKDGLAIATDGEVFFYIDKNGEKVIEETFKAASFFSDGRAWVLADDDVLYAIDRSGKKLFSAENATDVQLFYDGRSVVWTRDGFTEVLDADGNLVFSTEGYGGHYVSSDMLAVSPDGIKQGVMDMNGGYVLVPEYSSIGPFQWMDVNAYTDAIRPELFVVYDEAGGGVVGPDGNEIVPLRYTDIVLDGDMVLASDDISAKWYDIEGNVLIDAGYDYAYPFGEGRYAAVCDDGLWGFIDRKGDWKVYPQWNFVATSFDVNGLAIVYDNETSMAGMIDKKAAFVLPAEYSYISGIQGSDKYLVSKDGKFGIVDSKGRIILMPERYNLTNEDRDYQHYSIHRD